MKIHRRILESIVAHSQKLKPHECCGVLLSHASDPNTVDEILPAENAEKCRPQEVYVLGHKAHIKAVELEVSDKARIVGYYHSHPHGETCPSERDIKQARGGVTYLILGEDGGQSRFAAWKLHEKRFIEESVEVI